MVSIFPSPLLALDCPSLYISLNVGDPTKRGLREERGVTMGFTNLSSVWWRHDKASPNTAEVTAAVRGLLRRVAYL